MPLTRLICGVRFQCMRAGLWESEGFAAYLMHRGTVNAMWEVYRRTSDTLATGDMLGYGFTLVEAVRGVLDD